MWNTTLPSDLISMSLARISVEPGATVPVLFVTGQGKVFALDPETGKITWSSSYKVTDFTNDLLLVATDDGANLKGVVPVTEQIVFTTNVGNPLGTAISGKRFTMLVNDGYSLVCLSLQTGEVLWDHLFVEKQSKVNSCANNHFCTSTTTNYTLIDGETGIARWTHNGVVSSGRSNNEQYVALGDGGFLSVNTIYLVDASSGKDIWMTTLGAGRSIYGLNINEGFVLASYMMITFTDARVENRNSYPAAVTAFRLADAQSTYSSVPRGATLGYLAFFDNGDFAASADSAVVRYNGLSGEVVCSLFPVNNYNIYTAPGILGNSFIATYYWNGFLSQYVVRLTCQQ